MPVANKVYAGLFAKDPPIRISSDRYEKLAALKCRISYNKYGGYCVPESSCHRPAARRILMNGVYEPKTISFMVSNCGQGDIVHAGTYFGDFLPALSNGLDDGSKIWAFEPNPENFRCTKITVEINAIKNIELINAGLGEKQDTLLVKTEDKQGRSLGGGSRIISRKKAIISGTQKVDIVAIDDVIDSQRNVSIIQLDVEGFEKQALTGALKTIKRCLPIIILEVWPNGPLLGSHWFEQNILKLGYRKINELHGNATFSCSPLAQ